MSVFNPHPLLAECDSCDLEVADDEATPSGWTHVTERVGPDPAGWSYETYGEDDHHDALPREGTTWRFSQADRR